MKSFDKNNLIGKNFLGEVLDANDPEKEGRCKIKIFGMYNSEDPVINSQGNPTGQVQKVELPLEDIPWASPGSGKFFAGGESKGFGDISIPKKGSVVKITYPTGDIYSPEWTFIQNLNTQAVEEIQDSYENSHILLYDVDEEVKIFYTPSKGINIFHKNSQIIINPDSSITIEHKDSESLIELVGSKINIVSQSEVNVTSQDVVNVTTKKCVVDAKDIQLGAGATEALIKGNLFKTFFDSHTHAGAGSPPVVAMPPSLLSKISKTK